MALPEKASEALNQTDEKIKGFRKAMMSLLFEWQDLESRLEFTHKCFQEAFQVQESVSQSSAELEFIRKSFEQKEKEFHLFQKNKIREMEMREEKMGFVCKEIDLREKKLEEKEKFVEQERKQLEGERELIKEGFKEIGEKEKHIEMGAKNLRSKEEELMEQVTILELKEKEVEAMKKELELKGNQLNLSENQVGLSHQSMPHKSTTAMRFDQEQVTNARLKSKAWLHFTRIVNQDGSAGKAKCNYCHRTFRIFGGGTGHLLRHIFKGICPAYQTSSSAHQNHEVPDQTCSQQSISVQKEQTISQSDFREETMTPVMEYEIPVLQQAEITNSDLYTEPQMSSSETCAVHNTAFGSDLDHRPHQLKYLHTDQSNILLDQTGISDTSNFLTDGPVSQANKDCRTTKGSSGQNRQETQAGLRRYFHSVETESGNTKNELKSSDRKRNRENESCNNLYHEDIQDLSSPVKIEEPC